MEKIILEMFDSGYEVDDIACNFGIDVNYVKGVTSRREKKFLLSKSVDDLGNIHNKKIMVNERKDNFIKVKLTDIRKFKALLISDTHFGNSLQNINNLNVAYEYALENDIHIIIHAGDFIDGTFTKGCQDIPDPRRQIKYALENYPYDDGILNLICLGNHDYSAIEKGIDIYSLMKKRKDLIVFAIGRGVIKIGNDYFLVKHPINKLHFRPISNKLVLEGHKHKMVVTSRNDIFKLNIPPISNMCFDKNQIYPGAIEMNLCLDNNFYIEKGNFINLCIINDRLIPVGEIVYNSSFKRDSLDEYDFGPIIDYERPGRQYTK